MSASTGIKYFIPTEGLSRAPSTLLSTIRAFEIHNKTGRELSVDVFSVSPHFSKHLDASRLDISRYMIPGINPKYESVGHLTISADPTVYPIVDDKYENRKYQSAQALKEFLEKFRPHVHFIFSQPDLNPDNTQVTSTVCLRMSGPTDIILTVDELATKTLSFNCSKGCGCCPTFSKFRTLNVTSPTLATTHTKDCVVNEFSHEPVPTTQVSKRKRSHKITPKVDVKPTRVTFAWGDRRELESSNFQDKDSDADVIPTFDPFNILENSRVTPPRPLGPFTQEEEEEGFWWDTIGSNRDESFPLVPLSGPTSSGASGFNSDETLGIESNFLALFTWHANDDDEPDAEAVCLLQEDLRKDKSAKFIRRPPPPPSRAKKYI